MSTFYFRPVHFISLLLALVPLLSELPKLTSWICTFVLLVYIGVVFLNKTSLPRWIPQMMAVASGLFFYSVHGTLLTPEAASSLMCVIVCLKLFEITNHRHMLVFILMNLILSMFYVLFSQTLTSTLFIFVNYFFFIFFLLFLHKQKIGLEKDPFSLRQLLTLETLVALPLLIALFLFFPRFTTSWGGFGAATTQAVFGFSEKMNPGQLMSLAQSDLVAFRVRMNGKKNPSPENLYFRGAVLTENKGWEWKSPERFFANSPRAVAEQESDYEILLEPRFEKTLFTLDPTQKIDLQPSHLKWTQTSDHTFQLRYPVQSKLKIKGWLSDKTESPIAPVRSELQIDPATSEKLRKLVTPWLSFAPQERLKAILDFYKFENFKYSTETPAYKTVDDFLFEQKIGFCEHFSSSFAVLARLSGLPTRVVVGFQGAETNPFDSYLLVKDKHAHAWNEVYLQDQGWIRVDVTALVAPARILQGALFNSQNGQLVNNTDAGFVYRIAMAWDAVNHRFSLMLMNYNLENQAALLENMGLARWGLGSVVKVFVGVMIVFALFFWWLARRGRERVDLLAKSYLLLNQRLTRLQVVRAPNEGPMDLRAKVIDAPLANTAEALKLIDRYIALRFGPNATAKDIHIFYKDVKTTPLRLLAPK